LKGFFQPAFGLWKREHRNRPIRGLGLICRVHTGDHPKKGFWPCLVGFKGAGGWVNARLEEWRISPRC